jgi:hypothetical protein
MNYLQELMPHITDHALLRYFERVTHLDTAPARLALGPQATDKQLLYWLRDYAGLDVEAARAKLLTPKVRAAINARAVTVVCGPYRYVIKSNAVVTVTALEQRPMRPCLKKGHARSVIRERRQPQRFGLREALLEVAE